jgi:hypothetical protein
MKATAGRFLVLTAVLCAAAPVNGVAQSNPPSANLALELKRGICIDRQFRTIPPEPIMRITPEDIRLIKSMGFEFVKVLVNPEPLMSAEGLDNTKTWYIEQLVETVVHEQLPVVVCIHPEWEFKKTLLSNPGDFSRFLDFLEDTARFLAKSWGPKQLAFQLMTEPGANALEWNGLQARMWQTVRGVMPEHTLILAGDQVGTIEGLITTKPVDDANVLYSFTFYDPFVLTLQGAEWLTPKLWSYLGPVPYPSSPEILADRLPALLDRIPADPPDWRPSADGLLREYGEARWNREKIAARVKKLADWNAAHGGGLKIWCAEFGCYQRTIDPADRLRYIRDVRETFEASGTGWAYWSYNETMTVMTPERQPFGPAAAQTPDGEMLDALLGDGAELRTVR